MKLNAKKVGLTLATLCGALIMSFSAQVMAAEATLENIITSVKNNEKQIQDLKIEYTCVRKPFGVDESWSVDNEKYPGFFMPETGVLTIQGDKVKLERTYYESTSTSKQLQETISYDGSTTASVSTTSWGKNLGVVSAGRSHRIRHRFNPVLALSATGDFELSEELTNMDAKLAGTYEVDGVSCILVKLFKITDAGTVLRSYNVFLDTNRNYAPHKIEKYWYNFQCLEKVVEIKEFTKIGDAFVPSKITYTNHVRPRGSKTSKASTVQELNVTNISINESIDGSRFDLTFGPDTRVWDDILNLKYETHSDNVSDLE